VDVPGFGLFKLGSVTGGEGIDDPLVVMRNPDSEWPPAQALANAKALLEAIQSLVTASSR
jgi:hypothetical protein